MQIKCPHRKFYRFGPVRAVLVREHGFAPSASATGRMKPKRRRCGDRGRKPGQMVQIDHLSVSIEAGFSVKEFKAACLVSKLCYMCAYSAGRYEFHQFYDGELSVGPLNVELARFECHYNAYRPHQALGQTAHAGV